MAEGTGPRPLWLLVAIATALLISLSAAAAPERASADICFPECLPPPEEFPEPEPEPPKPPPGPSLLVINLGWNTGSADTSAPLEGSTIASQVEHLRNVVNPWFRSLSPVFKPWTIVPGGNFTISPPLRTRCDFLVIPSFQRQLLEAGDAVVKAAGFNLSSYSGIVFVYSRQICGGLDGFTDSTVVPKRVALPSTKATQHELGHVLGLPDAYSLKCKDPSGNLVTLSTSCHTVEYGDSFDSMGGHFQGVFNAMNQDKLGWMGSQVTRLNAGDFTRSFTLKPMSDASSGGTRALRLVDGPTTLWIEYRYPSGGDSPRIPAQQQLIYGVQIRREIGKNSALLDLTPQDEFDPMPSLLPGQTWENPLGEMKLTVNSMGPTGAMVTLSSKRVTVPNVIGLDPAQAQAVISGAGLWSNGWNPIIDPTCSYLGVVADQHPFGGTRVVPGTQVTLAVGEQDPEFPCF